MAKKSAAKKPAKKAAKTSAKKAARKPAKKTAKKRPAKAAKSAKKASKKTARKSAKSARAPAKRKARGARKGAPGPALLAANPSRRGALAPAAPAVAASVAAPPPARGSSSRAIPGPAPAVRAAFDEAFAAAPIQVRAIGARLRRIVLDSLPGGREEPFGGERVRGLRYYAAERHLNSVCSIQPGEDHCQLYFKDGSRFADPLRLLLGSGDGIRHVRVAGLDTPPESALRDLLAQGRKLAQ